MSLQGGTEMPTRNARASLVVVAGTLPGEGPRGSGQSLRKQDHVRGEPNLPTPSSGMGSPMFEGDSGRGALSQGQPLGPKCRTACDQVGWAKLQASTSNTEWKQRLAPTHQQQLGRQNQGTGSVCPSRWTCKHCGSSIHRAGPSSEVEGTQPG